MRKELCESLLKQGVNPDMVFLTGDLGFMALEPLEKALGPRFINAGVSEQNMISVAAAMAKDGWQVWCYSIAPFCFARPFEQIRNDVCLHDLPVKLLGNGGGYGYGVMGPTHHAVEDYGVLLALPNMRVFIPSFNEDVPAVVESASKWNHPSYLRLGLGELPKSEKCPRYEPWRKLLSGQGPVVVSVGPLAGSAWDVLKGLPDQERPNLWALSELPLLIEKIPAELKQRVDSGAELIVHEEHVLHGGVASILGMELLKAGIRVRKLTPLTAKGIGIHGVYGSQYFLRKHSGIDPENLLRTVRDSSEKSL